MLRIFVPARQFFDEEKMEFVQIDGYELQLEHSLVSLAKWEAKWCKPFLSKIDKTPEETNDYIRCMTMNQNTHFVAYNLFPQSVVKQVMDYINQPMTATTFANQNDKQTSKEVITAEIVYYWMITFNIPVEFQKWHLNRLLTLINVCSIKNQPPKKANKKEINARNRALNAERRAKYNTPG
jgi:hypothetical protein